jgi:hypothetical protein
LRQEARPSELAQNLGTNAQHMSYIQILCLFKSLPQLEQLFAHPRLKYLTQIERQTKGLRSQQLNATTHNRHS